MNLSFETSVSLQQREEISPIIAFSFLEEVKEVFEIFRFDLSDSEVQNVLETLEYFQRIPFSTFTPLFKKVFDLLIQTENQNLIREFFQITFCPTVSQNEMKVRLENWYLRLSKHI